MFLIATVNITKRENVGTQSQPPAACQNKQEGVWFSANKDEVKNESGKALSRAFCGRERQTDVHDTLFIALEQYKWLEKIEVFKKKIENISPSDMCWRCLNKIQRTLEK